ncbi:RNA-binding protein [Coccidioides immitis RS]|uniref:RNA-binding protein n=1 Tax=Coccidioides immitis (strain RS) TaxID=246410 RepID=A0A0E1S2D9_COCIM|nr:RNA-binding protein [Coccidioides immitis RS]EAS31865.1 RNA-binding protein [Coccidioides immitis RS]
MNRIAAPRWPAADRRYNNNLDDARSAARDQRPDYRGRNREDFRRSPPSWRGRSGYRDRDREGYRSPTYHSRSRSRSRARSHTRSRSRSHRRRPPHYGIESREVMMEGLPVEMNEEDISNELRQYYHVEDLEDVRVIRDRQTKISRQLGFLRFPSLDASRDFLERNYPAIYLYGDSSSHDDGRGVKVRIAYSREREDRNRGRAEGEWTCKICTLVNYATRQRCFRCQAVRTDFTQVPAAAAEPLQRVINTGDNDVSPDGTPSQFLLFRGLEPSVTEEILAKGVAKLYKPSSGSQSQGAAAAAKKGAKIASTTGDTNLGAREGSIRRILLVRDRRSNESWRYGFAEFATVEDAQSALTRHNSFETFTISSKPVLASYIHAGVFVPVLNPTASTERFTFSPLGNPSVKLAYWDEGAYVTELKLSTEIVESKEKPKDTGAASKTTKGSKDGDKMKKRKAEAGAASGSKKLAMPSHLQFWSDRHAELHGIQRNNPEGEAREGEIGSANMENGSGNTEPSSASSPPTQSYADLNRKCCYLCMRQFKTEAEVHRHERLSQLHRDNLQNEELKAKALAKLAKKRDSQSEQQPAAEYRDRAKERRKVFGSSSKPKDKKIEKEVEEEEEQSAVPTMSKGASLLGKMGWSAGKGLGAQGTGMTAPVATELYVQGVGLGAQGSKVGDAVQEASRNTRGRYDEFLEKTKDLARERYEKMQQGEQ